MKVYVIHGPNMNMLGIREPEIYGRETYADLVNMLSSHAREIGVDARFFQSNHEGALIDEIQRAYFDKTDGIIFNPAGYTHTSVAIADAVKATGIPTVEVHVSDVSSREDFRRISYVRASCVKTISGMGLAGYTAAMDFLAENYRGV